ncbi:MerR family DNA-binding transcriptional regulator [Paenibacillus macerans]|uniref:MerR regulatory family protein n=2 Tax=Paenibacillus TaxID=44249 RepID=A0A090ZEA6_PAEMA|nr:MerR family DNA-binding transcriptional regulator [Paenibacillus macerans]KFN09629.1 merR regulatory family protein [Paenibacillus macerans]MCY7561455.1 MerR family DNA-binding transcriptional regulator [Paenibacillus macerans]MDU5948172.1 MerR family DNA-binding transcriptional regulator [Paenibacillus macerans]MEC0150557.1 MerR family DNA-binding transcriptional regulator [Paenibacillus macerans]MEC0328093.1 MerR family DNA-binding transcriptional regulator [Paenibacillus macerans]
MRIQELADKMGLTIHTIRFYEKEGLLDARHVR